MKGTFAKAVAVVGVSCAAGLLIQTMAIAAPAPAGISLRNAAEVTTAQDQIRKKDRKKDGTCVLSQIRKRDQKKDGTCVLSQIRKRDQKKDGTCAV